MNINLSPELDKIIREHNQYIKNMVDDGTFYVKPKNKAQEIIIKPELIDTSNLKEGEGNKTLFRPEIFNEYYGQEKAKERLKLRIDGAKKLNEQFNHTLITGVAGTGKTTLAYILSKQLNLKFIESNAVSIKSEQQIIDKIAECDGGILFLDEIHKINTKVGTFLLTILEDFQINGQKIKPFTLIGATTDPGELYKRIKPFVRRFLIRIELEDYKDEDIFHIIQQYNKKKYKQIEVSNEVVTILVQNSKLNPALALSLFKDYICCLDIKKVLEQNHIVKNGFTEKDIKILKYLNDKKQGASKSTIACYLGIPLQNYENELEPFLIKNDYIEINSRRKLTQRGKEFLLGV